ncbi:MAG: hypothetical protein LQ340_000122 [Diploschistes diacapsis]|nr:MAG: hypothetical protein LQ340_000122 [Diploschistes diacapsis]
MAKSQMTHRQTVKRASARPELCKGGRRGCRLHDTLHQTSHIHKQGRPTSFHEELLPFRSTFCFSIRQRSSWVRKMEDQYQNTSFGKGTNVPPVHLQDALIPMLETLVPGLSILSSVFSFYFKIDITQYLLSALVFLAIATGVRHCARSLWDFFSEWIFSTAEIRYDDEMYNYLMFWVSKQKFSRNTPQFIAGTQTNSQHVWTEEDECDNTTGLDDEEWETLEDQPPNWDKIKELHCTPSIGIHFFRYRNHLLTIERRREDNLGFFNRTKTETIYLSCMGRNPQILKDLLQEAQRVYHERDGNRTIIYRGTKPSGGSAGDMEWIRCLSRPPRPLSTVVLDQTQKDLIVDDMREYLHPYTRRWYSNRGIPYRRGYLFYGPPGTGKTSLCFAMAGLLSLRIYVVSLNSRSLTEDTLANLFRDLPWRCIVLLEDIDSAGVTAKRLDENSEEDSKPTDAKTPAGAQGGENSASPKGITLSGFLNIIDGVASSEGRILCMTTNHKENLDPAILRPGRVDMTVRFGFADAPMIKGIYQAIFSNHEAKASSNTSAEGTVTHKTQTQSNGHVTLPKHLDEKALTSARTQDLPTPPDSPAPEPGGKVQEKEKALHLRHHSKSDAEIAEMAAQFAERMPADEFTPAEFQGYLLKHKNSPEAALAGVEDFVQEMRSEKQGRKGKK